MTLTIDEKQSIAKGFTAAGERIGDVELTTAELKEAYQSLQSRLKQVYQDITRASVEAGSYQGFWQNEEQAKAFGDLFLAAAGKKILVESSARGIKNKALGELNNLEGGALVPIELTARIIGKLGQYGKFRKNALVLPMGSDKLYVPKVAADLTIYAPGEGNTITDSDMEFSQVGLNAIKMACLCKVSNELDEDSIVAIGEVVAISMARSMAKKEDLIGFLGDGTSTYFGMKGIIGSLRGVDATIANIKGLKVGTGNAWVELVLEDFEGVVSLLPDDADDNAKWYVNRKFFFNVMQKLARGAGAADMFSILSDKKVRYFMGYPVEFVSCMPGAEANSQICAILGDLQLGAYLGERRQITIARSGDVYFANDQIGIRGIERISIAVHGEGDTTEAGPIVGLITAAA